MLHVTDVAHATNLTLAAVGGCFCSALFKFFLLSLYFFFVVVVDLVMPFEIDGH